MACPSSFHIFGSVLGTLLVAEPQRGELIKPRPTARVNEVGPFGRISLHDSGDIEDDKEVFWAFSKSEKELARLHIDYEKLDPYSLKYLENKDLPLSYCVEDKMRLSKDRRSLKVNDSLTLAGIPPETFEYRLGNRSALEWVIDQYQVTEDERSGIRSDPNRSDDPEYIVRLVGQVIRVSIETSRIVGSLPAL